MNIRARPVSPWRSSAAHADRGGEKDAERQIKSSLCFSKRAGGQRTFVCTHARTLTRTAPSVGLSVQTNERAKVTNRSLAHSPTQRDSIMIMMIMILMIIIMANGNERAHTVRVPSEFATSIIIIMRQTSTQLGRLTASVRHTSWPISVRPPPAYSAS